MTDFQFHSDVPKSVADLLIATGSGPEPQFDSVMRDFLKHSYLGLKRNCARGGVLEVACFGCSCPWLYRLTFRTRGLLRDADGVIQQCERHVVALRFQADYLRNANRFAMLRLVDPIGSIFHPNISPDGAICVEIYPGETLSEICQSLHDLFRWRLRQFDERDALNPDACAWGREHVTKPVDDRPLFGRQLKWEWQLAAATPGGEP